MRRKTGQFAAGAAHRLAGAILAAGQRDLRLLQPVEQAAARTARQLAPRGVQIGRRRAIDDRKERIPVFFQLFRPHPVETGKFIQRCRPQAGHLDQCAVGKHHIGRCLHRLGQFTALCLERGKQRLVLFGNQREGGGTGRGCLDGVAAQLDLLFVAQDRAGGLCHAQGTVARGVGADQVIAHHLAEYGLPFALAQIRPHAKGGQAIMATGTDAVIGHPAQQVDQIARAKTLIGAQDGRQRLAHGLGAVEQLGRVGAKVAIAASVDFLAKIAQQHPPPAVTCLGQPQQGIQPGVIGLFAFGGREALVDLGATQTDVIGAIQCQRVSRCPVAARAADFLIIGFDGFGQIGMRHPADIGLVHPHAKGDRGDHDQPVFAAEAAFDDAPFLGLQPRVIGNRVVPRIRQGAGQGFGAGAGCTIDNPRLALARRRKGKDLLARLVLWLKGQRDIGAVEAAKKGFGRDPVKQAGDDLGPGFGIGGRGKGRKRQAKTATQITDPQVIGPEIMAPLADAMGLVHGDQGGLCPAQQALGPRIGQTFGGDIEQAQTAIIQGLKQFFGFLVGVATGQSAGADAQLAQGAHLVAHQRDQRRDHHRHPVARQCRQLIAQRLAPARGHDRQHVAALAHGLDDFALAGAEMVETEHGMKKVVEVAHVGSACPWLHVADIHISGIDGQGRECSDTVKPQQMHPCVAISAGVLQGETGGRLLASGLFPHHNRAVFQPTAQGQRRKRLFPQPLAIRRVKEHQIERRIFVPAGARGVAPYHLCHLVSPAQRDVLRNQRQRLAPGVHERGAGRPPAERLQPQRAGAGKDIQHPRIRDHIALAAIDQQVENAFAHTVGGGAQMRRRVPLAHGCQPQPAISAADDAHVRKVSAAISDRWPCRPPRPCRRCARPRSAACRSCRRAGRSSHPPPASCHHGNTRPTAPSRPCA